MSVEMYQKTHMDTFSAFSVMIAVDYESGATAAITVGRKTKSAFGMPCIPIAMVQLA